MAFRNESVLGAFGSMEGKIVDVLYQTSMLPRGEKFAASALARTEMGARIISVFDIDPGARVEFSRNGNALNELTKDPRGFTLAIHRPNVLPNLQRQSPTLQFASLLSESDAQSLINMVSREDARLATLDCADPPFPLVEALTQSTGLHRDAQAAVDARTVNRELKDGATKGEAKHDPWNDLRSHALFLIPHVGAGKKGNLDANLSEIDRLNDALWYSSTDIEANLAIQSLIKGVTNSKNKVAAKLLCVTALSSAASLLGMELFKDNPELQIVIKSANAIIYDAALIGMGTLPNAEGKGILKKAGNVFRDMSTDEIATRAFFMVSNVISAALSTYNPDDPLLRSLYIATPAVGGVAQGVATAVWEHKAQQRGEAQQLDKKSNFRDHLKAVAQIFSEQMNSNPTAAAATVTAATLGAVAAAIQAGFKLDPVLRDGLDIYASGGVGDILQTLLTRKVMAQAKSDGAQAQLRKESKKFVKIHFGTPS